MLELADRLLARLDGSADRAGGPVVVATAVAIDGSAPRTVGTSMTWDGREVIGSIAGGCVEGAVVELAELVLDDGRTRTAEFGVSDELALGVGLSCGGLLRIHVALLDPASVASEAGSAGTVAAISALREAAAGRSARLALTASGFDTADCADPTAYIDSRMPAARFIIVGAMEFSSALSIAAQALGFGVTVVDPRELFTTPERFPGAELVVQWPPEYLARADVDARSVIALLSHDDRFDAEALAVALRSPAGFVGAMGSRRTHERRVAALEALGVDADERAHLHSPIGLDIGASTPEETAISILAEVLRQRTGATGEPLRETDGSIHARPPAPAVE